MRNGTNTPPPRLHQDSDVWFYKVKFSYSPKALVLNKPRKPSSRTNSNAHQIIQCAALVAAAAFFWLAMQ